jgi:hypothetical protein
LNIVTLFRSKEKRNSEHKANLTRITILRLLDRLATLLGRATQAVVGAAVQLPPQPNTLPVPPTGEGPGNHV